MCSASKPGLSKHQTIVNNWINSHRTGEVVFCDTLEIKKGEYLPFPEWLNLDVVAGLRELGVERPYSHQVTAWNYLHIGENTIIATPTASGKTLCYNVPVIDQLSKTDSTALYLFPTKALARDQENAIKSLIQKATLALKVAVYDGDTPSEAREYIRKNSQVVVTNPDMLHLGILPHHTSWASFFSKLAFVVIDELHTYRGVFGSHMANIMRRLDRIARFYSSKPVFAGCSATIANPIELAEKITGRKVVLVSENSAPRGARTFVVYNPAALDFETGIRRSALKEASKLAADLVKAGLLTLVFCQSRRSVEIVLKYLKDKLAARGLDSTRIKGYRGGYLPEVRREIETSFKNGALDAVVATNALELGIDIGSLDAVIMAGYPGTIAALHQRAGRAGRKQAPSLAVLVTSADPIDQFLAKNHRYLSERSPEQALTEPNNVEIVLAHLKCAAFELSFGTNEQYGNLSADETQTALDFLVEEGDVAVSKNKFYYVGESYPANRISLRSIRGDRVLVRDKDSLGIVAEVDLPRSKVELHDEAIYLSEGQSYFVESLNLETKIALVSKVEPAYYTTPITTVELQIINEDNIKELGAGTASKGTISVKEAVIGFKKIRFNTHENLGIGEVKLPPEQMETESTWLTLPYNILKLFKNITREEYFNAIGGLGHTLLSVASLRLMCDIKDLTFAIKNESFGDEFSETEGQRLFIYESHSGGVGLCDRAFDEISSVLEDAIRLIEGCTCKHGCPSCIGPFEEVRSKVKAAAAALARSMLG